MILPQLSVENFQILINQDRDYNTDFVWQYESAYFEHLSMFDAATRRENGYTCKEIRLIWISILESIEEYIAASE
jgi:hypothetical protein